jgi:hypothetical protein
MGTADEHPPTVDKTPAVDKTPTVDKTTSQDRRYGSKPGPSGGSNEPLGAYPAARPQPVPAQVTDLLGRSVLEARTQRICLAYGLVPRSGGLSRCYLARDAGLEIAADPHGVVTTVFLHFHVADGFTPYHGEIPGGAGSVPRRAGLWASLGRPDEGGKPHRDPVLGDTGVWDRWLLPEFLLHAQYAVDGQNLYRVTYTLPDGTPGASRAA